MSTLRDVMKGGFLTLVKEAEEGGYNDVCRMGARLFPARFYEGHLRSLLM